MANDEGEIEVQLTSPTPGDSGEKKPEPPPLDHCEAVGAPDKAALTIFIESEVLEQIHAYLDGDLENERGGVLVGSAWETNSGFVVHVKGMIPAEGGASRRASFTFTHEAWNSIYAQLESDFQGEKLVGWVHSHPGFGIFLSGHDLFIQGNFFNLPWQVALVYDPQAKNEGFFYNKGGKIVPAEGYFVVYPHVVAQPPVTVARPAFAWLPWLLVMLLALVLIYEHAQIKFWQARALSLQNQRLAPGISQPLQPPPPALQKKPTSVPKTKKAAPAKPVTPQYEIHVVQPGESLVKISRRYYGTPDKWHMLAKVNGLANPDLLHVGRLLVIPSPARTGSSEAAKEQAR